MSYDQDAILSRRFPQVAWATCTGCGLLHPVEELLDFDPVCPKCAAR